MKPFIQQYKKELLYSYTLGAYTTLELLASHREQAEAVYIHSAYNDADGLSQLCQEKGVRIQYSDAAFKSVNTKENTYVLGVFTKYQASLSQHSPHVVLVNPSDMGNLGTIIRTLAGLNITNIAIITPAADIWHPKTIRASMGALFRVKTEQFTSFEQYCGRYSQHELYPFMLEGATILTHDNCPHGSLYALIFGNEAYGLPETYRQGGVRKAIGVEGGR